MSAARYRKRPVEVEAFRFDGANGDAIIEWIGDHNPKAHVWLVPLVAIDLRGQTGMVIRGRTGIVIGTLEGEMRAEPGDWVIRGVAGEFYPCKPDIFDATYEATT